MRVSQLPSYRRGSAENRQVWGEFFGDLLRELRVESGRSIEQAASAAGMEVSQWDAVEEGRVPETWAEICRMTEALGLDRTGMAGVVLFCQEAWD
jgi:transcriptional regulator with XRE-family HTH domain